MNQKNITILIVSITAIIITCIVTYALMNSQQTEDEDVVEDTESAERIAETERIYNEQKKQEAASAAKPKQSAPQQPQAQTQPQTNQGNNGTNNTSNSNNYEEQARIARQIEYQETTNPVRFLSINVSEHKYKNILSKNLMVSGTITSYAKYTKYYGCKVKVSFINSNNQIIATQFYSLSEFYFPGATTNFQFKTEGGVPRETARVNYDIVEAYPYKSKLY